MGPHHRKLQDLHWNSQCVSVVITCSHGDVEVADADWNTVEDHANFRRDDPSSIEAKSQALCTEPMNIFHTYLQPFPPWELTRAEVVQIASITKKTQVSKDQFETAINTFFERVQKTPGYMCHFQGMKIEDFTGNTHITFVGWESVEVGPIHYIHTE